MRIASAWWDRAGNRCRRLLLRMDTYQVEMCEGRQWLQRRHSGGSQCQPHRQLPQVGQRAKAAQQGAVLCSN